MAEQKILAKIPPQGSLGLLAIGHKGLLAWRQAREEAEKNKENKEDNKQ